MSAKEARLRTAAQRKTRSVVYRILNVVFILVGVVHVVMTMKRGATDPATHVLQMEISILWLVIAGMWVGSVVYGVSYVKRPQRGSSAAFEARACAARLAKTGC
jgi:hypothetical protein